MPDSKMEQYQRWMRRALALAKKGQGYTSPNPLVGCVILNSKNEIIGEGYHKAAGLPHAEIEAINDAKAKGHDLAGSTVVVNLEPCSHHGRTPPCADALIRHKVARVIIGVTDSNPCVCGEGCAKLRASGIRVISGILEKQATRLNEPFFHAIVTGKPLVVVKVACSLDGKIATRTGHSQWISGPKALKYAHLLRARYDAICVGLGTVLADDPQLTYRGPLKAGHPLRVVLDSRCRIPLDKKIVSGNLPGKTLILTTSKAAKNRIAKLEKVPGVEVAILPDISGRVNLRAMVDHLATLGINSLLIEGGGNVLASALEADIVDQLRMVVAPMIIGGKDATPVIGGKGFATIDDAMRLEEVKVGRLGEDLLIKGQVKKKAISDCLA